MFFLNQIIVYKLDIFDHFRPFYNPHITAKWSPGPPILDWNLTPWTEPSGTTESEPWWTASNLTRNGGQSDRVEFFCWNFEAVGIPNMTFGGVIYTKCIPLFLFPLQNWWARALHFRMILGEGDQHIGKGYSDTSPPLLVWSCWPVTCNSKYVTWL